MKTITFLISVAALLLAGLAFEQSRRPVDYGKTRQQAAADAACAKQLGRGWVAVNVSDSMPNGGSCQER